MNGILLLAIMSVTDPLGAGDAYKLNYSALGIQGKYIYRVGRVDYTLIREPKLWSSVLNSSHFKVNSISEGEWGCDGAGERYVYTLAKPTHRGFNVLKPGSSGQPSSDVCRYEVLFDGMNSAVFSSSTDAIRAVRGPTPMEMSFVHGPFQCWGFTFAAALEEFAPLAPECVDSVWNGQRMKKEVYSRPSQSAAGIYQLEISYDPSINYLPQYMRRVSYYPDNSRANVQERCILEAERTSSGAFVPTKVAEVRWTTSKFPKDYPSYDHNVTFSYSGPVSVSLFELVDVTESRLPVSIERGKNAFLSTPGGVASLKTAPSAVSLSSVASVAGRTLDTASMPLPTLDKAELERYRQPRPSWLVRVSLCMALGAAIILVVGIRRRTRAAHVVMLVIVMVTGCEAPKQAPSALAITFDKDVFIYEQTGDGGPGEISILNTAGAPITIRHIDGGCTCRQIDQKALPATLGVSDALRLPVRFKLDQTSYERKQYAFAVDTDKGAIRVSAQVTAFPRHRVEPMSLTNAGLYEGESWSFELTHRQICEREPAGGQKIILRTPDRFSSHELSKESGDVRIAPKFRYIDTKYRIVLKDMTTGKFRESLAFVEATDKDPKTRTRTRRHAQTRTRRQTRTRKDPKTGKDPKTRTKDPKTRTARQGPEDTHKDPKTRTAGKPLLAAINGSQLARLGSTAATSASCTVRS